MKLIKTSINQRKFFKNLANYIYVENGLIQYPRHWDYDLFFKLLMTGKCFFHPCQKYTINVGLGQFAQNTVKLIPSAYSISPVQSTTPSPICNDLTHNNFVLASHRFIWGNSFLAAKLISVFNYNKYLNTLIYRLDRFLYILRLLAEHDRIFYLQNFEYPSECLNSYSKILCFVLNPKLWLKIYTGFNVLSFQILMKNSKNIS